MSGWPANRLPLHRSGPARPIPDYVDLLQLAEEIVRSLMVNGQGETADRLVLMQRILSGGPERNLGGWSCSAAISAVEKCLKGFGRKSPDIQEGNIGAILLARLMRVRALQTERSDPSIYLEVNADGSGAIVRPRIGGECTVDTLEEFPALFAGSEV